MDFLITDGDNMTFEPAGDIMNNIRLSLTIAQDSWFADHAFGLRRRERLKNTDKTARLLRRDCLDALQWIIDLGRAKSIEVITERDRSQDLNRIKAQVVAVQADGRRVTFDRFFEVY